MESQHREEGSARSCEGDGSAREGAAGRHAKGVEENKGPGDNSHGHERANGVWYGLFWHRIDLLDNGQSAFGIRARFQSYLYKMTDIGYDVELVYPQ
jgi:hypothetical protein